MNQNICVHGRVRLLNLPFVLVPYCSSAWVRFCIAKIRLKFQRTIHHSNLNSKNYRLKLFSLILCVFRTAISVLLVKKPLCDVIKNTFPVRNLKGTISDLESASRSNFYYCEIKSKVRLKFRLLKKIPCLLPKRI